MRPLAPGAALATLVLLLAPIASAAAQATIPPAAAPVTCKQVRANRTAPPVVTYIGNRRWTDGEDRPDLKNEAGGKSEFLAMAPWVRRDGPRDDLRAVGARLAPGSGDRLENDYLETAVVADLTFPRDPRRKSCAQLRR